MEADQQLKALERRLARAEWRLNVQSVFGGVLILVLLVASKYYDRGIGRAPFRVKDSQGNILMDVSASPDRTQTNLRLFPPGKDHVTVLYGHDRGGGLDLLDAGSKPLVGIGVSDSWHRGISLWDRNGKAAAWLGSSPQGVGLTLLQGGTQRGAALGIASKGGYLKLYDQKGKPLLSAP